VSAADSSGSVQAAAYTTQSEDGEHVRAAEDLQPVRAKRSHILSEQLGVLNEVSRLIYTTLCIPAVSDLEGVVCVCVCVRVP
jgi:hypothetical protein